MLYYSNSLCKYSNKNDLTKKMEEKITNIKERILYYIDYKGITKDHFFSELSEIAYGSFKGVSKKSALNSNAIAEIVTKYPDLSLTWLITGKGEMLVKNRVTRLLEFMTHENISRKEFAAKTKLSEELINNLEKYEDLAFTVFKTILDAYPSLNEDWLLYGNGKMIVKSTDYQTLDLPTGMVAEEPINYNRMPSVITVSADENENVEMVPVTLSAGYIGGGFAREDFIQKLPRFRLPFLTNGTFRCFGVRGYSMNRIRDNDYFVGKFLDNLANFSEGKCYAVISAKMQSMLIKRVFRHPERRDMLILRSDGNDIMNTYPDIHIHVEFITEMWAYEMKITAAEPPYDIEKFREILATNPKYTIIDND